MVGRLEKIFCALLEAVAWGGQYHSALASHSSRIASQELVQYALKYRPGYVGTIIKAAPMIPYNPPNDEERKQNLIHLFIACCETDDAEAFGLPAFGALLPNLGFNPNEPIVVDKLNLFGPAFRRCGTKLNVVITPFAYAVAWKASKMLALLTTIAPTAKSLNGL